MSNFCSLDYRNRNSIAPAAQVIRSSIDKSRPLVIFCIGTDRYIGDTIGPLVGTLLKEQGLNVDIRGTLEDPIHAVNLKKKIAGLSYNSFVLAIDACLGHVDNVGKIQIKDEPLTPGKGVGKKLPIVGDLSIVAIVDSSENEDFFFLHNIRLHMVYEMAKVICEIIIKALKEAI